MQLWPAERHIWSPHELSYQRDFRDTSPWCLQKIVPSSAFCFPRPWIFILDIGGHNFWPPPQSPTFCCLKESKHNNNKEIWNSERCHIDPNSYCFSSMSFIIGLWSGATKFRFYSRWEITITDCEMQMYSDCYRPITARLQFRLFGRVSLGSNLSTIYDWTLHCFWIIIKRGQVALFCQLMCLCAPQQLVLSPTCPRLLLLLLLLLLLPPRHKILRCAPLCHLIRPKWQKIGDAGIRFLLHLLSCLYWVYILYTSSPVTEGRLFSKRLWPYKEITWSYYRLS